MPIYEYSCTNCGSEWEEIQRITDEPLTSCPACGQPKAQRLISQTSFILKGSGWYVTDYGRGSGRKSEPPSKHEKTESSKEKSSDTSSKTAKKSDS